MKNKIQTAMFAGLALFVIYSALQVMWSWLFNSHPVAASHSLTKYDPGDVAMLLNSLAHKPSWTSTFSWWHSSWCPESPYPFWRPLTMQMFWIEKQLFTIDRYDRWMWVSFFLHLICIALYAQFIFHLSKRKDVTFLAVALYAGWLIGVPALGWNGGMQAAIVLDAWKNQPDLAADCFVFAALTCALRQRYWMGIACAFLAVSFKESGWMALILPCVILAITGGLKRLPSSVYLGAAGAAVVLLVLRAAAGPEVFRGYHMGDNQHWFSRFYAAVGGVYFCDPYVSWRGWITGHAIFAAAWLRARGRVAASWAAFSALLILAIGVDCWTMQMPLLSSLAVYFDPGMLLLVFPMAMNIYLWLNGIVLIWKNAALKNVALVAVVCGVIAVLPYAAAAQATAHTLHQAYACQSLFVAVMVAAIWEHWRALPLWRRFTKNSTAVMGEAK